MESKSIKTKHNSSSTIKDDPPSTYIAGSLPSHKTIELTTELDRTKVYQPFLTGELPRGEELPPTEAWTLALECLDSCDYAGAYRRILDSGDDLYLLRLMYKTGPDCYRLLDENTSLRLFSRVVSIAKSQFLNDLVVDFFFEACDTNLAAQMDSETIEAMLMCLECIQGGAQKHAPLLRVVVDYLKTMKTRN